MANREKGNLVPAAPKSAGKALASLPIAAGAASKLPGNGGTIRRDGAVTLVEGRGYMAGSTLIPAAEVYFDADKRPGGPGPWRGEADKVAWRDEETGYECIIMRDGVGGHLAGYVGVAQNHPLWGFHSDAIPNDVGIDVHGGITYSRLCDTAPSQRPRVLQEARNICHTTLPRIEAPITSATGHVVEAHQWWFGFSCDHPYDVQPLAPAERSRDTAQVEIGKTYRDDGYVLGEVRNLARQLKAIEIGAPAPPRLGKAPPVALDPRRRS